jgi:hypothetical protein
MISFVEQLATIFLIDDITTVQIAYHSFFIVIQQTIMLIYHKNRQCSLLIKLHDFLSGILITYHVQTDFFLPHFYKISLAFIWV